MIMHHVHVLYFLTKELIFATIGKHSENFCQSSRKKFRVGFIYSLWEQIEMWSSGLGEESYLVHVKSNVEC